MPKANNATTKKRRPADGDYWTTRHPRNMARRAIRVFRRLRGRGRDHHALEQARQCARAHGPAVEAELEREVRKAA